MSRHSFPRAAWPTLFVVGVAISSAGLAEAAPRLSRALTEQAEFLCQRTEFGRDELRALRASADFPALLSYTLGACPAVGVVLSDGATGSVRQPLLPRETDNDREPGGRTKDKGGEGKI